MTVCVQKHVHLLGEINLGKMCLSDIGKMVQTVWQELPVFYPGVQIDEFAVMPNHFHGIILLTNEPVGAVPRASPNGGQIQENGQPQGVAPTNIIKDKPKRLSLPDVVHRFKSLTTAKYRHNVKNHGWQRFDRRFWQRNYYEHIIRNEDELRQIREYIINNPLKWAEDRQNPDAVIMSPSSSSAQSWII